MKPKTVSKEVTTCSQIEALAKELSLRPFKKSRVINDVATTHSGRDLKKELIRRKGGRDITSVL